MDDRRRTSAAEGSEGTLATGGMTQAEDDIGDEVVGERTNRALATAERGDAASPERRTDLEEWERIPEIGTRWRWYDYPYRFLNAVFFRRSWFKVFPRPVRHALRRVQTSLHAFPDLERARQESRPERRFQSVEVPEGERILLPAYWLVELYSPSYSSGLLDRVARGKWKQTRFSFRSEEGPQASVQRGRARNGLLGWSHLATFTSKERPLFWHDQVVTSLPPEISFIDVHLAPLGSALTAVVAEVHLTESAMLALDSVVKRDHQPRLHTMARTLQVKWAMYAAIEDVQHERARLHSLGQRWLAKELPGIFAKEGDGKHPVLDLLLTDHYDPLGPEPPREDDNYLRTLGVSRFEYEVTFLPEYHGVRLLDYQEEPRNRRHEMKSALVARYNDVHGSDHEFEGYQGRSPSSIVAKMSDGARSLATRLSLSALLELKERRATQARDDAHQTHSRRPVSSAKALKRSVLRASLDLAVITDDVTELASSRYQYEWMVPNVHSRPGPLHGSKKGTRKNILRTWARRQAKAAAKLRDLDRSLLSILGLVASLDSSIEGIRSQRWSLGIAVLSLLSSGLAVWFAYLAITTSQ